MFRFIYGLLFSKSSLDKFAHIYWYGNQRSKPDPADPQQKPTAEAQQF
jgi:hypothetical protein